MYFETNLASFLVHPTLLVFRERDFSCSYNIPVWSHTERHKNISDTAEFSWGSNYRLWHHNVRINWIFITKESGFDSWQCQRISILHSVQTTSGAHSSSCQTSTGGFFFGPKVARFEADHSSLSSAEVGISQSYTSTPHIYSRCGASLSTGHYIFLTVIGLEPTHRYINYFIRKI